MKRMVTCTICPKGCDIEVVYDTEVISVNGYTCNRGKEYATAEVINPTRILTTTIRVADGDMKLLPVRSRTPIPKSKMVEALNECKQKPASLNVKMGDVVIKNVAETGVDMIVCCDVI